VHTLTLTGVEILRPGTFTDAHGQTVTVTPADLRELAESYDPAVQDAPSVVGHPKMDDPAYGWMRSLRVEGEPAAPVLLCDLDQVDPAFADLVRAGRYTRRSLSFYPREAAGNPRPGKLYPKHLGWLGARAPAVSGLKPVAFGGADDGAVAVDLAAPDWAWRLPWVVRQIAQTLSRLRDQTIERDGIEAADRVVESWVIDNLTTTAADIEASIRADVPVTSFANPDGDPMPNPNPDLVARAAALDQREAALDRREVALAAAEGEARAGADAELVDRLIKEGRLRPTERDHTLAELAALAGIDTTIALAGPDGETLDLTPHAALRRRLNAAPPLVMLGRMEGTGMDAIDLAQPEAIARAITAYQAEAEATGRPVSAAQALAHVTKRS